MTKHAAKLSEHTSSVGFFDFIENGCAYGWACILERPEVKLVVEITSGEKIVGRGTADIYRADLAQSGIGDGRNSFQIPISYELYDDLPHVLEAKVISSSVPLQGEAQWFKAAPKNWGFALIPRAIGLEILRETIEEKLPGLPSDQNANIVKAFELASVLQESGNLEEARLAWSAIAARLNNPVLVHCKLAETAMLEGRYEAGLGHYKTALSVDLQCIWAHLGASSAYALVGQPQLAADAIAVAQIMQPQNKLVRQQLIKLERKLNPVYVNEKGETLDFYHLADLLIPLKHNIENPTSETKHQDKNSCERIVDSHETQLRASLSKLRQLIEIVESQRIKNPS